MIDQDAVDKHPDLTEDVTKENIGFVPCFIDFRDYGVDESGQQSLLSDAEDAPEVKD